MTTEDLLQAIRDDVKRDLRDEILAEIKPEIEKLLYNNIFDLKGAVRYRKISESTIRKMIANKEIPYFKQRGQYFFRQRDLDKQADELVRHSS